MSFFEKDKNDVASLLAERGRKLNALHRLYLHSYVCLDGFCSVSLNRDAIKWSVIVAVPWPEVIKFSSHSTQLSIELQLFI